MSPESSLARLVSSSNIANQRSTRFFRQHDPKHHPETDKTPISGGESGVVWLVRLSGWRSVVGAGKHLDSPHCSNVNSGTCSLSLCFVMLITNISCIADSRGFTGRSPRLQHCWHSSYLSDAKTVVQIFSEDARLRRIPDRLFLQSLARVDRQSTQAL